MRAARQLALESVQAQFEAWRSAPHEKLIPDRLWSAACDLLDRYAPSTICWRLRLSPSRFSEKRRTVGGARAEDLAKRRRVSGRVRRPTRRSGARRTEAGNPTQIASCRDTFLELPPVAVALPPRPAPIMPLDVVRSAAGCCLVVDGAAGARVTVVLAEVDRAMVDAVCRLVLSASTRSSNG